MSLNISETPSYAPAPEGLHDAACITVADLGVQKTAFGSKHQILLTWELDALMEDGRPFTLSRRFTASLSKKASLRSILESWRGRAFTADELKGFALGAVLGKPCQVMVQHGQSVDGSRTYANIISVVPASKGAKYVPTSELVTYDQDAPDPAALEKLPEWIRTAVATAIPPAVTTPESEYTDSFEPVTNEFEDNIPF